MVTPDSIKASIEAGIACDTVEVAGDGQHFEALIVSDAFRGLPRLARHRLVYAALGDRMRAEIHALLRRMATDGCAQLLVSSDAEELLETCDRILVMRGGAIVEEMVAADATEATLLSAAAGL